MENNVSKINKNNDQNHTKQLFNGEIATQPFVAGSKFSKKTVSAEKLKIKRKEIISRGETQNMSPPIENKPNTLQKSKQGFFKQQFHQSPIESPPIKLKSEIKRKLKDKNNLKSDNHLSASNLRQIRQSIGQSQLTKINLSLDTTLVKNENEEQIQQVIRPIYEHKHPTFEYYNTYMEMYHRYPNENDYFNQMYRQTFLQNYHALKFCRDRLKQPDSSELEALKIKLGPINPLKKKTLIFDLDETLIHCNENMDCQSDLVLPITFPEGEIIEASINIRPYVTDMLRVLSRYFEIVVFTASYECYASAVIDHLDPEKQYIDHRLYREYCITSDEGVHIKDLRIFEDRELKNLILVDNAAYSFGYQISNGIPILPFYENKKDQELRFLTDYLKNLLEYDDIRDFNSQFFKMKEYGDYDSPEDVLEMVYGVKQQIVLNL